LQIALARHARAAALVGVIALAAPTLQARAAELSILDGNTIGDVRVIHGRPWELQYLQELIPNFGVSFSYLNEAQYRTPNEKVPWHHARDGGAVQAWAMTPMEWFHPFQLAVGAGPYVFFDTQSEPPPFGYRDYHSVAEMYTGSLRYFTPLRGLFVRLDLTEIHAPGDPDARILELGFGYQSRTMIGPSYTGPSPGESAAPLYEAQLTVLIGRTGDSNWNATQSNTYGVEYRQGISTHLEVSGTWLSEEDGISGRHDGLAAQIWLTDRFFSPRFTIGIGAGPYVALRSHIAEDGQEAPHAQGVVAMTASYQLWRRLVARVVWDRAFTNDALDRDIVLGGLAWSWNW
jgi:hypothetical protein